MENIDGLSPESYQKMCEYTKLIDELNKTINALEIRNSDPVTIDSEISFTVDGRKHMINNIYSIEMLKRQVRLLTTLVADLKIKETAI